jgi:biopolymer transport protein ExbB
LNNSIRVLSVLCLVIISSAWAGQARAWWNDDWAYRKEIDFDLTAAGADIKGPLTDIPVLVRLSLGNFQYFSDANGDGSDLRFIGADDKTPLKFHIERFDTQTQTALLWVRMPQLAGGAKTDKVYLYYGNKKAVAAADAGGTYDTNQALVYHFGAPKGSPQDSTAYKSEPSAFGPEIVTTSLIGSGVHFGGAQAIAIPANGSVHMTAAKGFTLSAWLRIAASQTNANVAQLADGGHELVLGINGNQAFARFSPAAGTPVTVTQSTQLTSNDWHHVGVIIGDGHLTLVVDGVEAGQADAKAEDMGGVLMIGGSAANSQYLTGDIDELEVSNAARSVDYLRAAARSQGMVAPLVIYGGDAQRESGGQSYFATTLRSVTIDGWVIIGVLAVMFVFSLIIMITKGIFLARVAGGNTRFMGQFRATSDDPAALERQMGAGSDDADLGSTTSNQFGVSTIWPIYHHGMSETLKRLGPAAGEGQLKTLSAQSIEAIRASLDASIVRLQQRLNSQMVFLTIAIAGGPFLGLLGTVVGVMITFAAIAASGEVNINAIAPGTAAALVATVAGLGVAIPCLFGYNFLNTRVRELTADMRVFADEFVARIAETYS